MSKRRKLTPFLCQEMLYDYAMGTLDKTRSVAVEEFLKTDAGCQTAFESIKAGLRYTERVVQIELKPEIFTQLRESENAISLGRRYSSFSEWRDEIRWAIVFLTISASVAAVIGAIPWSKLPSLRTKKTDTIQIAAISRGSDQQIEAAQERQEGDLADIQGSGDEEIEDGDETQAKPPTPTPSAAASKAVVKTTPTPVAKKVVVASEREEDSSPSPSGKPQTDDETPVAATTASTTKAKGFVYRAFMSLPNLDELGPKIAENITELRGEKAGEVELGWKRGEGRYYHFTLPDESEEKLLEKLRAYGPVRISKDPHSRVMPKGKVRFILWVEPLR